MKEDGKSIMSSSLEFRRAAILKMVNEQGSLNFSEIRAAFPGVSDVTLRKDLQFLDDSQQAIRTHGGIKSMPSALNYFYRANVNRELKKEIAAKAAALIKPGDSIFLSAGTSCAELACCLPSVPLKLCSDGVYTVSNISTMPNISVELLGGEVDLNIMRVEGISALNRLENLHFTIAFIGALGINLDYGFLHNSAMTVALLEKVVERADKVVALVDHTKITNSFTNYTLPLSTVDVVVSDREFPKEAGNKLGAKGIEVI